MSRIKNVDVLGGRLFSSIIKFGIPLLLVALIQSLFNAVDIMVLGQMADTNAVAAVGATTSIVHLLVTLALGVSVGAKIVLARLIGEGARDKTQQTVFTSIVTAVTLGLITMATRYSIGSVVPSSYRMSRNYIRRCKTLYEHILCGSSRNNAL